MVLYKAIKYYLLERAIDVLFRGFLLNMNHNKGMKLSLSDLRIGMNVSKIVHRGDEYINCTIEQLYENFYNNMYFIRFECTETTEKGILSTRDGKYLIDIVAHSYIYIDIYL